MLVPQLGERSLRRQAWAEQVDSTKEALDVVLRLALDAVVAGAPRAVLGLVGDAHVDAEITRCCADVGDVDLGRRGALAACDRRAGHVDEAALLLAHARIRNRRARVAGSGINVCRAVVAPAALASEVGAHESGMVKVERCE